MTMKSDLDDCEKFYADHRGGGGKVILVEIYQPHGDNEYEIFSSIERAREFIEERDELCMIMPRVVDCPHFGVVTLN